MNQSIVLQQNGSKIRSVPFPQLTARYAFKCHRKSEAGRDIVYLVNVIAFYPMFRPRVLVDVSKIDTSTSILGYPISAPKMKNFEGLFSTELQPSEGSGIEAVASRALDASFSWKGVKAVDFHLEKGNCKHVFPRFNLENKPGFKIRLPTSFNQVPGWKASELRLKSWDEPWKLWYVVLKLKNIMMTQGNMLQAELMFPNPERI
ncbi:hypothetical protein YC2023_109463 [Brassica napus]